MSRRMDSLQIEAYAKINLGLKVLTKRPDGYHNIETLFQSISLADQLQLKSRPDKEIELVVKPSLDIPVKKNLVYQAVQLLRKKADFRQGVSIRLKKNIPVGSGLGGGSSDAAATLAGLNKLFQLGLSQEQLLDISVALGSDVPFFLLGGRCRGAGRGEHLVKVPFKGGSTYVVLFCPPHSLSTEAVYAQFDKLPERAPDAMRAEYENDLERAALKLCPELATFSKKLASISLKSWMTGSGTAYYTILKDPWRALALSKRAARELKCKSFVCRFTSEGHRLLV